MPIPSYVLSHIAVGKIVYLTVFSSDHITSRYLVSTILAWYLEKIWHGKYTYGTHAHRMADPKNQLPLKNKTKHTQNIKHHLHGPPKPPASRGSNFTGECDRCTARNRSRSSQHRDVIYIDDTNFSFIYLTAIWCAVAWQAHWLKVSFKAISHDV
jgi:hypothetical protein